jgi:excisionase family DNA binding protein
MIQVLTVKEVCDLLRVHQTTLYRLIKAGGIPSFRIGSDYRFQQDLIERWMAEESKPVA